MRPRRRGRPRNFEMATKDVTPKAETTDDESCSCYSSSESSYILEKPALNNSISEDEVSFLLFNFCHYFQILLCVCGGGAG